VSGLSSAAIRNHLSTAIQSFTVPITVYDTVADLRAAGISAPNDAKGVANNGRMGLVAANIPDLLTAESTLWHEVFHTGFRKLTASPDAQEAYRGYRAALQKVAAANANVRERAAVWREKYGKDKAEQYRALGLRGAALDDAVRMASFDEAIADIAGETGGGLKFLSELIAAIQRLLRALGFNNMADWMEGKTDAEVLALIRESAKSVMRGPETGGPDGAADVPAYSADGRPAEQWYSALARGIESAKQTKATASEWKAIIAKMEGAKKDEIEAVGLSEWLDLQQGVTKTMYRGGGHGTMPSGTAADVIAYERDELGNSGVVPEPGADLSAPAKELMWLTESKEAAKQYGAVSAVDVSGAQIVARDGMGGVLVRRNKGGAVTKSAILDFVRANGVQVREVVLGNTDQSIQTADDALRYIAGQENMTVDEVREEYGYANDNDYIGLARTMAAQDDYAQEMHGAKFASYQLPGGENYRELLLTLPRSMDGVEVRQLGDGSWRAVLPSGEAFFGSSREDVMRRFNAGRERDGEFKSPHFDEPNIIAHVRFNERTDAEGKRVLFIEELQSDWAQKGRKIGFQTETIYKVI
jgi:hypothetical protein